MNRIYCSNFNAALGAWVAVPETAKARGKRNGLVRAAPGAKGAPWFAFTALMAGMSLAGMANAQTWTGDTDTNWNTATNWTGGTVPAAAGTASINTGTGNQPTLGTNTPGLASTSVYAGTLTIASGGNLVSTDVTIAGTGKVETAGVITGAVLIADNGVLALSGNATVSTLRGNGAVQLGSNTLTVDPSSDRTSYFSGVISGTGGLIKAGGGTQVLTGANTYTGTTTLEAGDLTLSGGSAIANTGAVVVNGGVLALANSETIGALSGTGGAVQLGSNSLTVNATSGSADYAGVISGTGSLIKSGTGTLLLSGANTYSGGTTVSAGTLQGNSASLQGNILNNAMVSFDQATDGTYASAMTGSGSLFKTGAGVLTLSGSNTHTGTTTLEAGGLTLSGGSAIANTGAVVVNGGTLTLENSETIGALSGGTGGTIDLGTNTNTLTVSPSSVSSTYAGTINGAGGLTKTGSGTLTLSGVNAYTGDTTLNAGTLAVSNSAALGDATGAIKVYGGTLRATEDVSITKNSLNFVGNATLAAASNKTLAITTGSFGHNPSVPSTLTIGSAGQDGTVELSMTVGIASNKTPWGFDVVAGTLQAGSSIAATNLFSLDVSEFSIGTAGRLNLNGFANTVANLTGTGSIVNNTNTNASLLTKGTTDFGGVIADGTGFGLTSLNVTSGTTTLTGANTYSGGTTVSGGTLQGSSTSLQGNILNNAMVNFEQATDGTYAGVMSGTGSLSKTGAGALTLSGTNTYSGATLVNGGLLTVNGSIANSAVTLSSGGRLGGTGTFGSMIVNGGVLAPGNSIGTQTVNGNLTMSGASTYEVETDPTGSSSDLVQVNGVANLGGQVRHVGESGTYLPFSTYTILSATGGFAGSSFAGVTSDFAFLTPSLTYDLNNVYLNLQRNSTAVADLAQSRNQLATAGALDSLPAGGALQVALLGLKTNEVPDALNALSGEVYASTAGALLQNSQAFSNSLLQRSGRLLDESQRSALPLWIETQGATRRNDGDSNSAEATQRGGSVAVGGELAMPNDWILGGAFRYGDHRLSVDQLSSHADIDSYSVGLYGRWAQPLDGGSLRMTLGGIYGWHSIDAERDIYTTGLRQSLNSDYDATSGQVFAELGYAMDMGAGIQLEPYAALSWTQVAGDSFTEKGGNAALHGDSQNNDMTTSTLGLRSQLPLSNGRFNLDAGLAWQHNYSDVNPDAELNFVGSSNFTVDGASMGRDKALLDLGASYRIAPAITVRAGYSGQFGNNVSSNGGNLTLSWEL